jgi:hypothetical protein
MTQQSTKKEYNTFVKGLVTEAGPLTFPENASLDEANCVLNRDGSRQRRLGMDFEDDYVLRSVTIEADDAVAAFRWESAANDVNNQLAVVQAGQLLLIFDATQPSISAALLDTVDLSAYITGKTVISADSGMGYFFVTGGTSKPLYLSYNVATQQVTATQITLQIRDFFGVSDGLDVDETPAVLSTAHHYNLLNQGWPSDKITAYEAGTGNYPSNAQQWFLGKDAEDNFDPDLLDKQEFGTTPAPKGRFIIDAFARSTSRNSASGLVTAADLETGYPRVVGFGFSRAWYAGVKSVYTGASEFNPNMTGFVFYSRTLRGTRDFGQCYSDADPTSEVDSELVDTDGGFITIPNSGPIHMLLEKGSSMLVFAEKGIWEIFGGEAGFTAAQQQVTKITSFGVLGASSIVDAEDAVLYWNQGGIYLLAPSEESGRLTARSITEETIQTYYNAIDKKAKLYAVGAFDPINRKVMWMYNDDEDYDGVNYRHKYNKELVLDTVLNAFYPNTISAHEEPSPYIAGYLATPDFLLREEGIRNRGDTITKYLTVQFVDEPTDDASISFAYYRDPTFRDWVSSDGEGTSFSSYIITGYEILGDSTRMKQSAYAVFNFKRTERTVVLDENDELVPDNPSGCIVQAQWDWSDDSDSGKWGQEFQAYRLIRSYILGAEGSDIKYGHEVITTKNRLPGSGKALSLYIRSDEDKDFYLYGWALRFTGQQHV